MASTRKPPEPEPRRRPKATTPEARENQLVAMAFDYAEKQFREGTASAAVTVHLLKLRTTEARLREEKLRKENMLLEARANSLGSSANAEAMYAEAIKAIHLYQGHGDDDDEDV